MTRLIPGRDRLSSRAPQLPDLAEALTAALRAQQVRSSDAAPAPADLPADLPIELP